MPSRKATSRHRYMLEKNEPLLGKKPESCLTPWILGAVALLLPAAAAWTQVAPVAPVRIRPATPPGAPKPEAPKPEAGAPAEETGDEYRGAADPLLDSATEALLRRVRGHIEAEEWNEVVEIFDAILSSVADRGGRVITLARRPGRARPGGRGTPVPGTGGPARPDPAADRPAATFTVEDAVVSSDGILYRPIAAAVRKQLLALPEEARELYRRTHQAAANQRLEAARAEGGQTGLEALRRLAVRYPLTDAGSTAWHLLGLRLLDAGRTATAANALETRLALPFGPADPPRSDVLAQALMAHLLSGAARRGLRRLEEIETDESESTILVRGQAVGGHEVSDHPLFKTLIEKASRGLGRTEAGAVWPTARGSFDNCAVRLSEENRPDLGSHARWIFPPGATREARTAGSTARSTTRSLVPGTAASHGLIFIRGNLFGGELTALDARSGKIEWRASPRELAASPPRRSRSSYGVVGDLGVIVHTLPVESSVEATVGDTLDDGTVEKSPRKTVEALVVGIDRQSAAIRQSNGSYRFDPNRLVAYGARSGRLLWSLFGGDLQSFGVASLTFIAPPVSSPTPGGGTALAVTAISQESFFLVGLSASGEPRWCRRLYDHDFAALRRTSAGYGSGQLLASRGHLILATPGHGVCSAIDFQTGDVVWVSRYRSKIRSRSASPRWIRPAPMLTPHLAVVTPADSDYITAFDLDTGAIAWERRFRHERYHVLGADDSSLYLCSDRLHTLNLEDGRDAWVAEPFKEALGRVYGEGFLATDSLTLPFSSGAIGVFSTADGTRTSLIKLQDRRLSPATYKRLFPVSGTLYAATGEVVFAIESQADSWTLMSRERRQDLLKKALLYRAERRFHKALEIYYDLHGRYRSKTLRKQVEKEVLATVRDAAKGSGDPAFLTRLLEGHDTMLADSSLRRSFELLEAKLLLDADTPEARRRAVKKFLQLTKLERVLATSPDELEVDVATYASDVLRDVRLAGETFDSDPAEAASRSRVLENQRAASEEPELTSLSRIALRSSHLEVSALALARLISTTAADVGAAQALPLFDLLLADYPALARLPAVRARRAVLSTRAGRESRGSMVPELPSVFTSGRPLEKRYWIAAQEGFLAASVPHAPPAPALLAICGSEVRAYDEHGAIAFKHELPDYPDVSEVKQHLKSQYEEPASVYFGEGRMILFTPAGLFGFSYKPSPLSTSERENRVGGRRSTAEVKTLRFRWAQPHRHPLLGYNARRGITWGGLQLPEAKNFFAKCGLLEADPLVLLPDGEVYQVKKDSGKLFWRATLNATPTSGLETYGSWTSVRTSGPTGLRSIQLPASDGTPHGRRFVEGPAKANHQARAVLGQLVTVFAGGEFAVIESLTGWPLWRKKGYLGRLAFAAGDALWISEPGGKLRARSVRSGRIQHTVHLPGGATVIDVRDDPGPNDAQHGRRARTLVALGGHSSVSSTAPRGVINKVPTGRGLYVIRLDAAGDKVWESQVHGGAVVYGGSYFHAADGRFILAFNAEGASDQWYTKLVSIDPRKARAEGPDKTDSDGQSGPESGAIVEVASIEINGKGTMLPPRLSLLEGAIGLGNTDGFGWLEPGGGPLGTDALETDVTDEEQDADDTARSGDADRE